MHELLASDLVAKIKQCEGCTWLFIDTSKNHRRRWCAMATSGNRAKAQRHYQSKAAPE
ncbi:CGNR zinc finger domain-containing protein [Pseudomonas brenneri]